MTSIGAGVWVSSQACDIARVCAVKHSRARVVRKASMNSVVPTRVISSFGSRAGRTLRSATPWVAAWLGLAVAACSEAPEDEETTVGETNNGPGPTSAGTSDGTGSEATTGSDGAVGSDDADDTSGDSDTSGEAETSDGSDTDAPITDCNEPQEIPAAPAIDCSGADGVLTNTVIIEDGGDQISLLEGVRRIEGSLRINRLDTTNLDFMACLQEVTGDVTIFGNDQLTNVDGLWGLTTIGTDFVLSENNALTDFDGLPNVTVLPRNLVMQDNASLTTISGFQQLDEVGDNLLIQSNPVLLDVNGLGGLRTVGGVLAITANDSLCISSVNCVGIGITDPAVPPETWSTQANDLGC
jgi:hypothetical protein